ncbi:hypothetical protein TWF694_010290 [Orbilia ellipsospora]|uniref:Uncharacterized protein n=1 Tax=Orbilia ellipsospora TaxID=2528407 RepID=A0AAV9X9F5_9PEZI
MARQLDPQVLAGITESGASQNENWVQSPGWRARTRHESLSNGPVLVRDWTCLEQQGHPSHRIVNPLGCDGGRRAGMTPKTSHPPAASPQILGLEWDYAHHEWMTVCSKVFFFAAGVVGDPALCTYPNRFQFQDLRF